MSEAVQALAFVARREARRSMPATRWSLVLSLELGWMTPAQARRYVEAAEQAGILVPEGEEVALAADPASVQVPRGFRPNPEVVPESLREPEEPASEAPFAAWLQRVATATGKGPGDVMAGVTDVQGRFGGRLGALPALLLMAREAGLDAREAARAELEHVTSPA